MGFDIGSVLAMNKTEMKATRHLYNRGQNRWLDSFTRELPSSQTHRLSIGKLSQAKRLPRPLPDIGTDAVVDLNGDTEMHCMRRQLHLSITARLESFSI
jgi:hypothetical protein